MEETVAQALERFLQQPGRSLATKNKFRYKFKLFLDQHGHKPTHEITSHTIEEFFHYLQERKVYSEGHLAFHRSCHVTFWGWLGLDVVKIGRYDETPAAVVTATDAEIRQLLATCERLWSTIHEQRDAAIVAMGTAGLRRSNIQRTRTSEARHCLDNPLLDDDESVYYILPTKGKEAMDAVLDEQRAAILRRYLSNRPVTRHDRLFINLNQDDGGYLDPLSSEGFIKARRRVCRAAGLRLISFQQMRRWFGTRLAKSNSIQIAAQALGHKSGVGVVLKHYYNPEKKLTQTAVLTAYRF